jgi:hypothetical protein
MIEGLFLHILHPHCAGLRMTRFIFSRLTAVKTEQCLAVSSSLFPIHCLLLWELLDSNIVLYT